MRIFEFKKPRELFDQTIHQYQQKARATQASKTASFYAGHWTFDDEITHKRHTLEITPNLLIQIDYKPLTGKVILLSETELIFLDHFGYQLKITCENHQPISIYDEAEDTEYPIK